MANENKICIIYWGLIRGFRFDYTFNSHKQYLYDNFKNNNIDFDVYLVTNNIEYNEINVDKIPNLKTLKIIDVDEIHNLEDYKNAYKNIGSGLSAFGENSASCNTGNCVTALGYNAGYNPSLNTGNCLSGQFIVGNNTLPSYLNYATASASITVVAGAVACNTYLFYNQANCSIEAIRL